MIKSDYSALKRRLDLCQNCDGSYEARIILSDVAGVTWADIVSDADIPLTEAQQAKINDIVAQRQSGTPLSRILGVKQFWGLDFHLNEATLDPRPDTEILVEKALPWAQGQVKKDIKILDLGTGTGCIIISLLHELTNATGVAVDISPRALEAAQKNATTHAVNDRLTMRQSNWFDDIGYQKFDLIVSNPPYISPQVIQTLSDTVQNHDPILALDGGEDGLDPYKIIFSQLKKHLTPMGRCFVEIGYDQCGYIQGIANNHRIRICDTYCDYAGNPRVVEISCGDK